MIKEHVDIGFLLVSSKKKHFYLYSATRWDKGRVNFTLSQHITVAHFSWLFLVVDIWVDQSCNILIKCCMIKEHIDIGFFKEKTISFILGNPMGQREGEFHPFSAYYSRIFLAFLGRRYLGGSILQHFNQVLHYKRTY